jgi:hypothetical protein
MKIFFDTEFTGLHKGTKLISIGMISEDAQTFYAENGRFENGFHSKEDEAWIETNIIPNLKFYGKGRGWNNSMLDFDHTGSRSDAYGEMWLIRDRLTDWLERFESVEMWSDCLAYDWVLFNHLWGHAFNIPKHVYYIPFDICTLMKIKGVDPDINREEFAGMTVGAEKHNALWDARVIKACHDKLIHM